MSIQATLNQGLSIAALLATQSPAYKAKQEERLASDKLARKESALRQQIESISNIAEKESVGKELSEVKKQQFELKPSSESYKAYKETTTQPVATFHADPEELAMEAAESRFAKEQFETRVNDILGQLREASQKASTSVQAAQEQKRKSRRNFIDYMKDEPTSWGLTFGELDKKVQKNIAKQYTKKDKQQIMDRKDAENE